MMMNKKKFGALLLSGVMLLGMPTSVLAAGDAPTQKTITTNAEIKKSLEVAEGVTIPKITFKFTATKITEDAPEATIPDITYEKTKPTDFSNGLYSAIKTSKIAFGTFPHAGEYEYDVKEIANTYAATPNVDEVTYSKDTYRMRVYVVNDGKGGTKVESITAEKNASNGADENKVGEMLFTNIYTKRGNSNPNPDANPSLVISKEIIGDSADLTRSFQFTITMKKSPTETEAAPEYTGYINDDKSKAVRVTADGITETTFTLSHNDKLIFKDIPAGTRYVVTEVEGTPDGFIPSVQVTEDGVQGSVSQGTDGTNLSSAKEGEKNLIGEGENIVKFTNEYKDIATTGIIMNNLPFILLIVVAITALGALAIVKRHRTSRR